MNPSLRIFSCFNHLSSLYAQLRLLASPSLPVRVYTFVFLLSNSALAFSLCYVITHAFTCHGPLLYCIILNYTRYTLSYLSIFENVLSSLTQNPLGLKLHPVFSTFLSSFCILHIDLWRSILSFLIPPLTTLVSSLPISPILYLNLTLSASLLINLLRLFTLPLTILQLYSYKITIIKFRILKQLGLLFIGKNWNPITRRDSSVPLDIDQLVISTLIFVSLLFLLPTLLALNVSVLMIWAPVHFICCIADYVIESLIHFQSSMVSRVGMLNTKLRPLSEREGGGGVKWSAVDSWVEECRRARKL